MLSWIQNKVEKLLGIKLINYLKFSQRNKSHKSQARIRKRGKIKNARKKHTNIIGRELRRMMSAEGKKGKHTAARQIS